MNIGSTRSGSKRATLIWLVPCLLGFAVLLGGCSGASDLATENEGQGDVIVTATAPLPTSTPTTKPTNTVTPFVVIQEGEALPVLDEITAANAKKIQEIGRWGSGVAYAVEWSPDGEWIAISTSRYLLLVDVQSMQVNRRIAMEFPLYQIAFSPDGNTIYGGGTLGKLLQYDITTDQKQVTQLGNVMPITAVAVSHNGQYVLSADWQKYVQLWNLESGVFNSEFASTLSGSQALGFSADDETAFSWSPIEPIRGWTILDPEKMTEYYFGLDAEQRTGTNIRFSADGNSAAVNQTWQMRVQNLMDGTTIGLLKDFYQEVEDLDISTDGQWVLSLHADQIRLWQSAKSKVVSSYALGELAQSFPVNIRISPDGSRFLLLGRDLIFFDIDAESQAITQTDTIKLDLATDLSFDAVLHSENRIYQVGLDGAFYQTDLQSAVMQQQYITTDLQISAYAVSSSFLVTAYTNKTIELRDLDTMEVSKTLRGLSQIPQALLLSEDQDLLIAQSGQSTTGIWQLSSGNYLSKQEWDVPLDRLQFSGDEQYLIGSGNGQTQVFNIEDEFMSEVFSGFLLGTGKQGILIQPLSGDERLQLMSPASLDVMQHLDEVKADRGTFSQDGSLFALSGKELQIWDMNKAQMLVEIENPARGAEFYFSNDYRLLVFVFSDGSILLYGVPS